MSYTIIPTKLLIEQVKKLDKKTRKIIHGKKELIKLNPYRYKKIRSKKYNHVFGVKLTSGNRAKRLIYLVLKDMVFLCFILDRDKNYKNLEKLFQKVEKDVKCG